MLTVNIRKAKANLSRLVARAARGEPFVVARAGKPLVQVTPLDAPTCAKERRRGFLAGDIAVPDNFDQMGAAEIAEVFGKGE